MRSQLTDAQPAVTEQAIMCEWRRVRSVLGADFEVRMSILADSLAAETTKAQGERLDSRLNGAVVAAGNNPLCGPINEDAQREVPLPMRTKRGAAQH